MIIQDQPGPSFASASKCGHNPIRPKTLLLALVEFLSTDSTPAIGPLFQHHKRRYHLCRHLQIQARQYPSLQNAGQRRKNTRENISTGDANTARTAAALTKGLLNFSDTRECLRPTQYCARVLRFDFGNNPLGKTAGHPDPFASEQYAPKPSRRASIPLVGSSAACSVFRSRGNVRGYRVLTSIMAAPEEDSPPNVWTCLQASHACPDDKRIMSRWHYIMEWTRCCPV